MNCAQFASVKANPNFPQEKKENGRIMPTRGTENSPVPISGTPPHSALHRSSSVQLCSSLFNFKKFPISSPVRVFRGQNRPKAPPFQCFQSKPSAIHTFCRLLHF